VSAAKRGRPPLAVGAAKDVMFCVRLTPDERAALVAAAALASLPVSEWARRALLGQAKSDRMP
jgi:hypothetical protein